MSPVRRISRDDLYALVWKTPMSRLATDFGISGNGLAKICTRLDVPYPPRGYWAKKEHGKLVTTIPLPKRKDGIPERTEIFPTPAKPKPSAETRSTIKKIAAVVAPIQIEETLDHLHPKVKAWIAEHRRKQKESATRHKAWRDPLGWGPTLLPDLTDRDLYRFRVTSTLLKAVEKAGGKVGLFPTKERNAT